VQEATAPATVYKSNNPLFSKVEVSKNGYQTKSERISYKKSGLIYWNFTPLVLGGIIGVAQNDDEEMLIALISGASLSGFCFLIDTIFSKKTSTFTRNEMNISLNRASNFESITEAPASATNSTELEKAIARAVNSMKDQINNGAKIAVLNISSSSNDISSNIIDEVMFQFTQVRKFIIVDRQALDAVRSEQLFQFSGEVDDNTAVNIGKMLGAEIVITGSLTGNTGSQRLVLKALNVQSAQVVDMARENVN
jgi:hypothetical protein